MVPILNDANEQVDPFSVVSLFAGAGGLDLGFHNQGFNVIWANDIDPDACETHRMWSNATVIQDDIGKINMDLIPKSGVIIGGFPCQGFSLAGPRKIDDERNKLYKFFVELVEKNQPYIFVAENVKGILTLGEGLILEAILQDFSDRGYDVYPTVVNAADYGVPQERWRVVMIGFRKDLNIKNYSFPPGGSIRTTIRDALKDIPEPSDEDICQDGFSSRYMSRNRKRSWDSVSYTIPAMGKQIALHPSSPDMVFVDKDKWVFGEGKTRRFSWQEAAAIQTFPPGMKFAGNLTSKYRQIGNAVPVRLAEVIAKEVRKTIETLLVRVEPSTKVSASQTKLGKGFEYACLLSINNELNIYQTVKIIESAALIKAKEFYYSIESEIRENIDLAANAATHFLLRHEPNMKYNLTNEPLELSIQSDSKGQQGDVRDVIIKRGQWSIGLSCKRNNEDVKHPRLSSEIDFGEEWLDYPCSDQYFEEIGPIFNGLFDLEKNDVLWEYIENKEENYYRPLLQAFKKELDSLSKIHPDVPEKLVSFMIGHEDFYKIVEKDANRTTGITPYNIHGGLNHSAGSNKPESKFDIVKLPTRIIETEITQPNVLMVICDNGWTLKMRIHNAKKKVEASLKFAVTITGRPDKLGTMIETW